MIRKDNTLSMQSPNLRFGVVQGRLTSSPPGALQHAGLAVSAGALAAAHTAGARRHASGPREERKEEESEESA